MNRARKHSRHGHRDATMILVAYRHGLRASEVCDLRWQQIELSEGRLHVHRVKNGIPSVHPIRGDEMRALRKLRRDYPKDAYVFVSEQRVGEAAKMPFPIHPQMLRHACGFKLGALSANKLCMSLVVRLRAPRGRPAGFPLSPFWNCMTFLLLA